MTRCRRESPAVGTCRAREDESTDVGGDRLLEQRQRARDVRVDECSTVVGADVRFVQGRRVQDGVDVVHGRAHDGPVRNRADDRGVGRGKHIKPDDFTTVGVKGPHQRLPQVPGAARDEESHAACVPAQADSCDASTPVTCVGLRWARMLRRVKSPHHRTKRDLVLGEIPCRARSLPKELLLRPASRRTTERSNFAAPPAVGTNCASPAPRSQRRDDAPAGAALRAKGTGHVPLQAARTTTGVSTRAPPPPPDDRSDRRHAVRARARRPSRRK